MLICLLLWTMKKTVTNLVEPDTKNTRHPINATESAQPNDNGPPIHSFEYRYSNDFDLVGVVLCVFVCLCYGFRYPNWSVILDRMPIVLS